LIISVRAEDEAIALAQPNVLNLASFIFYSHPVKRKFERVTAGKRPDFRYTIRIFDFADIAWIEKVLFNLVCIFPHKTLLKIEKLNQIVILNDQLIYNYITKINPFQLQVFL